MTAKGVTLSFPDGRVFEFTRENTITTETQPQFLIDGLRNFTAVLDQFVKEVDVGDSLSKGVFEGTGAIVRVISVTFVEETESGMSWGDAPADASARQKKNELEHALTTVPISSSNPVTFEGGEYSSSGRWGPLKVVAGPCEITYSYGEGESPSTITGRLQLYESVDTGNPVDSSARGK